MDRPHIDPSQLCFERVLTRRLIIASYWLVIILAVPLWWKTTSIERLSLPTSRVHAQQQRKVRFPVSVHVEARGGTATTSLAQVVESQLIAGNIPAISALDIQFTHPNASGAAYKIILDEGEGHPAIQGRDLFFYVNRKDGLSSPDIPAASLTDTITGLFAPYGTYYGSEARAQRVFTYSPRYRLAFSLLNEDATSGNAALAWDVQRSIQKYISPTLEKLSVLHNFTIESQVQFHAPLAFEPRPIEHDGKSAHGLTYEDLTVFVNSAEWTLSSSVSNDPVIHFVLFIPSSQHSPLYIVNNENVVDPSNAFLLPQWGGVTFLNPTQHVPIQSPRSPSRLTEASLEPVFKTFAAQLLTLLGVPGLPPHVTRLSPADGAPEAFSDWELDALLRRRAAENAWGSADTLASIVRLVDQIENMPVGQDVRGDVQDALAALDEVHAAAPVSPLAALQSSARALTHASRAFFNPGMLALLYFPAEHTYAVYTPLFASVAAPLLGAVVRELSAWRRERRNAATAKAGAEEQERVRAE